jgi:zinc protease
MAAARAPLDRSLPPRPGEVRLFRFPPFRRVELANGLTVFAARFGGVPLVSLELVLPASAGRHEPEGRAGLATLTAGLLDEGTARQGAMEIAERVERLGGYLATGADWDVGYLATGLLASHTEAGVGLLAEIVGSPAFPAAEVERLRRQRLAEILRRGQDPSALADDAFSRAVYRGTVYANSLLGDEPSVGALDRDAVLEFYRRHYTLRGATMIAVGDLDPEELIARAAAAFADGPAGEPPPPPEIRPPALPGVQVHIVDRPGAAQTELRLGHAGVPRSHPDYPLLTVLNTLLGGKFTSRINLNLRERHGYTYGASTRFLSRLGPGPFLATAAVATESAGAAAREVLYELRRIREEPAEPAEIEETRSYVIGVFPYTVQTIGDLAKRFEILAVHALPSDYFDHYLRRIAAVTVDEVQEAARRHLHPDRIAVVAVGPAEQLAPQFAELGAVTVEARPAEPELAR